VENSGSRLGKLTDFGMKLLYRRADKVITVSRLLERDFATTYGVPAEKITTIYNPYDFDDMRQKGQLPLPEENQSFFESGFVFANVGRMVHQKGLWHLVKAFAQVHEKRPEAKLVMIGEDWTDGKLPALLEKLQLQESVLLTGRVRNPYQYLQRAQCYVLSSLFEGFPNALVEAMACGLPVIAADCPSGPREILYREPDLTQKASEVTEADYGLLIPLTEAQEDWEPGELTAGEQHMAQAMEQLLTDEHKRTALAQKALQRSHTFDFAGVLQAFSQVIG
jgi:glycosyltransferase involved in cell wall biosynthesis